MIINHYNTWIQGWLGSHMLSPHTNIAKKIDAQIEVNENNYFDYFF